jgi:dihydrofolate reductase
MRKLVVSEYVTVDGVIEDPGGAEKFTHGGWTMPYWNDEIGKFKFDELFASDALLLGRVTYQGFAAAWPSMTDEAGFADRMNNIPKYVVSKTLNEVKWKNSRLIKENIADEVSRLKQQSGRDILIYGSAALVQSLRKNDLIDEYQLLVYPVALGSGKRLFGGHSNLKLVGTKTFSSGVVALHYQPERTPPPKSR